MRNLAEVYKVQGEHPKVDMLVCNFQKDVESVEAKQLEYLQKRSARGDNNVDTLTAMFTLADCYFFQNKFAPAKISYNTALELMKGMTVGSSDGDYTRRNLCEDNIKSCRENMAAEATSISESLYCLLIIGITIFIDL